MKLRVYIAAASAPQERARLDGAFNAIREIAHVFDWRIAVDAFGPNPAGSQAATSAVMDLEALAQADLMWLLVPVEAESRGCWVELGYAIRNRALRGLPHIVTSGERSSIFVALSDEHHTFDRDAAASILEHATKAAGRASLGASAGHTPEGS